ncbi:hypothetical protein HUT03_05050 [Candidatus Liberibacter africanus]|uniref:hypothetical protein n=1 Tax=Liberibacter africanus TaxID=34020 RepID=UPI000ADDA934|nr:hypothetical protein [Candidatus Liberibacter africanus]QTP64290.1 hypothetical protein HUT03_05050 [Candidatus Liberibacter africanus]
MLRCGRQKARYFSTTARGKPFSSSASFGNWFRDRCKGAGLPNEYRALMDYEKHEQQYQRMQMLVELIAIYGWSKTDMDELYNREVNAKNLLIKRLE